MKSFFCMLGFLTRIPIPKWDYGEADFIRGLYWKPWIGLLLGFLLFLLAHIFGAIPYVMPFVVVFLYAFLTGGLHLDGLSDSIDGYFSARSREKSLEIMKDSRIGTFGAISLILVLVGDMLCMMALKRWAWILLFPMVGRSAGLWTAYAFDYAREEGLGKTVVDNTTLSMCLSATVATLGLSFLFLDLSAVLAAVLATLAVLGFVGKIAQRLGGITGDTIGLSIELSQLFFLIFAHGIWGVYRLF